jgi:hypothetical protein
MRYLCICVILLSLSLTAFALKDYESDTNHDGKPDKWVRTISDDTIEITMDQNYDGVIDYRGTFTKDWKPIYEEFDYNYDGKMDTFYFYDKGLLVRQEIDSNFDGKIDIWIYIDSGKYITKYAADTDFDGKIDKVIDYTKKK